MYCFWAGPQPSTYINASFIEGYDNSESIIITQDPMEETIADFWRMISEQSINTIVMISEVSHFQPSKIFLALSMENSKFLSLNIINLIILDRRWTTQMSTLLG